MEQEVAHRPVSALSLEEFEQVKAAYTEYQKCIHCNQHFLEADNIGQLKCRLHPGVRALDPDTNSDYYTCCQYHLVYGYAGGLYETLEARGCLSADHFAEEICEDDQVLRHEDLFEMSVSIVPTGLFWYGLLPPLPECVLYQLRSDKHATEKEKKRQVTLTMPFDAELIYSIVVQDALLEVSEAAKSSPVLLRQQGDAKHAREARLAHFQRLEEGWPSTFDEDMAGGGGKFSQKKKKAAFSLPFVIVKRISTLAPK